MKPSKQQLLSSIVRWEKHFKRSGVSRDKNGVAAVELPFKCEYCQRQRFDAEQNPDPSEDPEYQAFVADQAQHCRCRAPYDSPCAGVLAGGMCDDLGDDDELDDPQPCYFWDEDDYGDTLDT